jgi:hypothetical protein
MFLEELSAMSVSVRNVSRRKHQFATMEQLHGSVTDEGGDETARVCV